MSATPLAGISPAHQEGRLTDEECNQAREFLKQAETAVAGACTGLSEAQWRFRPAPDRWSIAEILDHIVRVQESVLGPVLEQVANSPAPPKGQDTKLVDSIVIDRFSNRLTRYPAPELVRPAADTEPAELLARVKANSARLAERLNTPGLRQHAIPAPPLKAVSNGAFELMDGYQWILAAAGHTERHAKQMLEVRADAGYPGSTGLPY